MEVLKGITLTEEAIKKIQEIAKKEKRSFSRQAQLILEEALKVKNKEEK